MIWLLAIPAIMAAAGGGAKNYKDLKKPVTGSILKEETTARDIHEIINNKLIEHSSDIDQGEVQIQKVTVNCEGGRDGLDTPFFKSRRQEYNWAGALIVDEPVGSNYGCCPSVNQEAGLQLKAVQSTAVTSVDSMLTDIESKLKSKAEILDTDDDDKQAFFNTLNESRSKLKNDIEEKINNHTNQHGISSQEIEFTVDYPLRCPAKDIDETTAAEILASDNFFDIKYLF